MNAPSKVSGRHTRGVRLVLLQLGNLDLTSSAEGLMLKVLRNVVNFERQLIIERTQAGQARASRGEAHGSSEQADPNPAEGHTRTYRRRRDDRSGSARPRNSARIREWHFCGCTREC